MFLYSFILYSVALWVPGWTECDNLYVQHLLIIDNKLAWTLNIEVLNQSLGHENLNGIDI